jgi:hypothetical protein
MGTLPRLSQLMASHLKKQRNELRRLSRQDVCSNLQPWNGEQPVDDYNSGENVLLLLKRLSKWGKEERRE